MIFDLAYYLDVGAVDWVFVDEELAQVIDVLFGSGKRYSNKVDSLLEPKIERIILISLRNGGQIDGRPRQAHILPTANLSIIKDLSRDNIILNL